MMKQTLRQRISYRRAVNTSLLVSIILSLPLSAWANNFRQSNAPGDRRACSILVWKVGSPHTGDVPAPVVSPDLQEEVRKLGCAIEIKTFPAMGFANTFFNAILLSQEPDILAFNNFGIIKGITTARERFEGIGSRQDVRETMINVSESLRSLEPSGGWQFLVRSSRNHAKARALAMRGVSCNPNLAGHMKELPEGVAGGIKAVAMTAARAHLTEDVKHLDALSGGKYREYSLPLPGTKSAVNDMVVCGMWGTSASPSSTLRLHMKEDISWGIRASWLS